MTLFLISKLKPKALMIICGQFASLARIVTQAGTLLWQLTHAAWEIIADCVSDLHTKAAN